MWLVIDETVFWGLNQSLAGSRAWQVFWAVANNRAVDVVSALLMTAVFLHFLLRDRRNRTDTVSAIFLMFVGLAIVGVQCGKAMDIGRYSPTLVHSSALRLSELVASISTKDISANSFPGDHATVLFIFVGVVSYYLPRTYATAAWLIAAVFMVPRLMGGAHWLTDDLVGSTAIAVFVLSCAFGTPLHRVVTDRLERWIGRIHRR